jgi:molybdopterin synthase sulfur carrier subunit
MSVNVKFFASLRERMGVAERLVDVSADATVQDVWAAVSDGPIEARVLVAVNRDYASPETRVRDGDEVAFFPPVTGG